jgi:hypothetical protein
MLALNKQRLKYTVKSMRMMNGLLFKNSIPYSTLKNRNNQCSEMLKEKDSSERNSTDKSIKKKIDMAMKLMKIRLMMIWLKNTPNFWNKEREKRPMLQKRKL